MQNDFSPMNFMRGTQHTSIKAVGGREYLQVSLKKGCYGTDSSKGCGLYGRMPVSPGSRATTMSMEYTCVAPVATIFFRSLGKATERIDAQLRHRTCRLIVSHVSANGMLWNTVWACRAPSDACKVALQSDYWQAGAMCGHVGHT